MMINSRGKLRATSAGLGLIASSFAGTAAMAKEETLILQASSQWQLDYSPDSCKLARQFGEGEQALTLLLTRYSPSARMDFLLAGPPIKSIREAGEADIRFGAGEEAQDVTYLGGTFSEKPAMIVAGGVYLHHLTDEQLQAIRDEAEHDPKKDEADRAADLLRAEAANYIQVDPPRHEPIRLETGSLGKPFQAFDRCIDELVHHWGVDVPRYKLRSRDPEPIGNVGKWVTFSDYPSDALRKGAQSIVHFRLSVGEDGKVTDCYIQGGTEGESFQDTVCRTIKKRARFKPALDADGRPLASYYISTVRFEIPS